MRDPYDVLGLGRSANEAEVKRAYRKLAKENHPDRQGGSAGAQAKFSEINSAYEILGDKEKRAQFDRGEIDAEGKPRFQGFEGFRSTGGQSGFENVDPSAFAEMFSGLGKAGGGTRTFRFSTGPAAARGAQQSEATEDLLRNIFGGGRGRSAAVGAPGADLRAEVAVTLEDIAAGTKPRVTLPSGKTVALSLPSGVTDGQVIRLQGQGETSFGGGPAGDALVTVRFVPHPMFKPEGSDLRLDLPISLDEAVLGAKVAVPTLSGKVQVTIPPYSSSGRTLRLKGKGLPKQGGGGDLLVSPRIVLPDGHDPDLESLMQRWRQTGRSNPRGPAFD